jgi:hypothetical protein
MLLLIHAGAAATTHHSALRNGSGQGVPQNCQLHSECRFQEQCVGVNLELSRPKSGGWFTQFVTNKQHACTLRSGPQLRAVLV